MLKQELRPLSLLDEVQLKQNTNFAFTNNKQTTPKEFFKWLQEEVNKPTETTNNAQVNTVLFALAKEKSTLLQLPPNKPNLLQPTFAKERQKTLLLAGQDPLLLQIVHEDPLEPALSSVKLKNTKSNLSEKKQVETFLTQFNLSLENFESAESVSKFLDTWTEKSVSPTDLLGQFEAYLSVKAAKRVTERLLFSYILSLGDEQNPPQAATLQHLTYQVRSADEFLSEQTPLARNLTQQSRKVHRAVLAALNKVPLTSGAFPTKHGTKTVQTPKSQWTKWQEELTNLRSTLPNPKNWPKVETELAALNLKLDSEQCSDGDSLCQLVHQQLTTESQLLQQVLALQKEQENLQAQLQAKTSSLDKQTNQQVWLYRKELDNLREKQLTCESSRSDLLAQLSDLSTAKDEVQLALSSKEAELFQTQTDLKQTSSAYQAISDRLKEVETTEVAALQTEVSALHQQLSVQQSQALKVTAKLQSELDKTGQQTEVLRQHLTEAQEALLALQGELAEKVEAQQTEVLTLTQKIQQLELDRTKLVGELTSQTEVLQLSQKAESGYQTQISTLQAQVSSLVGVQTEVSALSGKLAKVTEQWLASQNSYQSLLGRLQSLTEKQSSEAQVVGYVKALGQWVQFVSQLFSSSSVRVADVLVSLQTKDQQLKSAKVPSATLLLANSSLLSFVTSVQREVAQRSKTSAKTDSEKSALQTQVVTALADRDRLTEVLSEKDSEIAVLQSNLAFYRQNNWRQRLAQIQSPLPLDPAALEVLSQCLASPEIQEKVNSRTDVSLNRAFNLVEVLPQIESLKRQLTENFSPLVLQLQNLELKESELLQVKSPLLDRYVREARRQWQKVESSFNVVPTLFTLLTNLVQTLQSELQISISHLSQRSAVVSLEKDQQELLSEMSQIRSVIQKLLAGSPKDQNTKLSTYLREKLELTLHQQQTWQKKLSDDASAHHLALQQAAGEKAQLEGALATEKAKTQSLQDELLQVQSALSTSSQKQLALSEQLSTCQSEETALLQHLQNKVGSVPEAKAALEKLQQRQAEKSAFAYRGGSFTVQAESLVDRVSQQETKVALKGLLVLLGQVQGQSQLSHLEVRALEKDFLRLVYLAAQSRLPTGALSVFEQDLLQTLDRVEKTKVLEKQAEEKLAAELKLEQTQKQILDLTQELSQLKTQDQELLSTKDRIQSALATSTLNEQSLQSQFGQCTSQVEALQEQVDELTRQKTALQKEADQAQEVLKKYHQSSFVKLLKVRDALEATDPNWRDELEFDVTLYCDDLFDVLLLYIQAFEEYQTVVQRPGVSTEHCRQLLVKTMKMLPAHTDNDRTLLAKCNYFMANLHLKDKNYKEAKASLEKALLLDNTKNEEYKTLESWVQFLENPSENATLAVQKLENILADSKTTSFNLARKYWGMIQVYLQGPSLALEAMQSQVFSLLDPATLRKPNQSAQRQLVLSYLTFVQSENEKAEPTKQLTLNDQRLLLPWLVACQAPNSSAFEKHLVLLTKNFQEFDSQCSLLKDRVLQTTSLSELQVVLKEEAPKFLDLAEDCPVEERYKANEVLAMLYKKMFDLEPTKERQEMYEELVSDGALLAREETDQNRLKNILSTKFTE